MADTPVLRSKEQIFGDLVDGILARLKNVTDFSRQSVMTQILEAVSQVAFKSSADIIQMIDAQSIDRAVGEALQRLARDRNVPISAGRFASGRVSVTDLSFAKIETTVYAGQPAPVAGSQFIYVADGADFSQAGSVYIGRGTPNVEGPLAYTSVTPEGGGAYWKITLDPSSLTTKFHNIGEKVIMGQGGNRTVANATIVQTPQGSNVTSVQFKTSSTATILDGETTVNDVPVVCTQVGTIGNVPKGSIQQAVGLPFEASVNNPRPFSNGAPPDNNDTIRSRIKAYEQAKSKGTEIAIRLAAQDVVADDELKKVASANVVRYSDVSAALVFDDGTGYEPLFAGVGLEQVVDEALGGEVELQLRKRPIAQARITNNVDGPYDIQPNDAIDVEITGDVRTHFFAASDFKVAGSGTSEEVVNSINSDPNFHCYATTANDRTRVVLYPRDRSKSDIQIIPRNTTDANDILGFPISKEFTIRLYRSDLPLYEDGIVPTILSRSKATWATNILSGDNLTYKVDGSPEVNVAFNTADFQAIESTATMSFFTAIEIWLEVFNNKMPGVSASLVGDQVVFVSNLGANNRAALEFTGGTLKDKIFQVGVALIAAGRASDYTLNKQTGQLSLSTPLIAGESVTAGSTFTRAKVLTTPIPSGPTQAGNAWFILDGSADLIPNDLKSNTQITFGTNGPDKITILGQSPLLTPEGFDQAQAGDWILIWTDQNDNINYPNMYARRGFWRIDSVSVGTIIIDVGDNSGYATGSEPAIPTDRLVIIRSTAPLQQLSFPTGTLTGTANDIEDQLAGVEAEVVGSQIRLSTVTADTIGQLLIAAADTGAKAIGLQPGTLVDNITSHYGFVVTDDSEAGTPTFSYSAFDVSGSDLFDFTYLDQGGTLDNFAELLNKYDASALREVQDTNKGRRILTEDYNAGTGEIDYLPPKYIKSPGGTPIEDNDRYFLRSSYQFDSRDSATFIVDGDTTTKTYAVPVTRRLKVNSHSTPSLQDFSADDVESSLPLANQSSFYDFDFKDFKVWRQAGSILTDGTYQIQIKSADYGPAGDRMRVGFIYPKTIGQTDVSVEVSQDEVASIGIVIPVKTPRTANWDGSSAFTTSVATTGGKDTITYQWRVGTQPDFSIGGAQLTVGDVCMINDLSDFLPENRNLQARVSNVTTTSFSLELPAGRVLSDNIAFQSIINQNGLVTVVTPVPHRIQANDRIGFWNTAELTVGVRPFDTTYFPTIASPTSFTVPAPVGVPGGTVVSGTHAANIITITAPSHGLNVGNTVLISGVSVAAYNGTYSVYAVPNSNQFQYIVAGSSANVAGGRFDFQSFVTDPVSAVNPTTLTRTGSTVTVNVATHAFVPGDLIEVTGVDVDDWVNVTVYGLNDIIEYSGIIYVSLQAGNTGNQPDISPTFWAVTTNPFNGIFVVSTTTLTSFTYTTAGSGTSSATGGQVQALRGTGRMARCVGANGDLLAFAEVEATAQQVQDWITQNVPDQLSAVSLGSPSATIKVSTQDLDLGTNYLTGNVVSIRVIKGSRTAIVKVDTQVDAGANIRIDTGANAYDGEYVVLESNQNGSDYDLKVQTGIVASSSSVLGSSSGTFIGFQPYEMLRDGENWVKSSNLQSLIGLPQFTAKRSWLTPPAVGEEVRLIAITADHLVRFWSKLVVTGLSNVARVDYSEYGRQVQITTNLFGSSGSIQVAGGKANAGQIAIVGSGAEFDDKVGSFNIPYEARSGLNAKHWIRLEQAITQNKQLGFAGGTVLQTHPDGLEIISGSGTFQTQRVTTLDGTTRIKIERHGDFLAFIGVGGAGMGLMSDAVQYVREGDWVRIKNTLTGSSWSNVTVYTNGSRADFGGQVYRWTGGTQSGAVPGIDPLWVLQDANFSNEGVFRVVRVYGNDAFWIEAETISEKLIQLMAAGELSFYSYDSVMPGDALVIAGTILGATNVGRYDVVDESFGVGYQFPTPTRIYTSAIPLASSPTSLGDSFAQVNVEEDAPISLLKRILTVAPGPTGYATVIVDSPNLMNRISSTQAAFLTMENKLGYGDDVKFGVDSYRYYRGLIAQLNRVIYGDPTSPTQYPGVRAGGTDIDIKAAITKKITISVAVRIRTGIPFSDVRERIKASVAGYVNTLGVGEQVSLSRVVEAAGKVNGVLSVVVTFPTYDAGNDLIFVPADAKAQITDPTTDVTVSILGT